MMLADFDLHMPRDLDGALAILAEATDPPGTMPLAGGTNLMVDLRARTVAPSTLVGIGEVADLRGVEVADGRVLMGARTTVSDLLRLPRLAALAPSLVASAGVFAGQMVRNTATVGGNVCYGSPAADLVPPLLVLDAQVTLQSRDATRTLPLAEFFLDYRRTVRRPDELLTRILWPAPASNSVDLYYKLARRKGDAIAVVGVAVGLTLDDGICRRARIALASVAPTVLRARAAEHMLEGEHVSGELIEAAAEAAAQACCPIDDVRASARYRRHGARVLTRRLLHRAHEELSPGLRGP